MRIGHCFCVSKTIAAKKPALAFRSTPQIQRQCSRQDHGDRLQRSTGRPGPMEFAPIGRSRRRTEHCGVHLASKREQHFTKNELKPHLKKQWCIGTITAEYLWRMEQVLDIYERPHDTRRPVVCFDERPCRLLDHVLMRIPMKPGRVEREDYHYKRNGTCVVLMAVEPLAGRRIVRVTQQKTKKDYARFMQALSVSYPEAERIVVVQDNLNTHNPSSFYEAFPAAEAFALAQRFEMVYTPKKASWLNMAEIELSALSRQCLDRRIAQMQTLTSEVSRWTKRRNCLKVAIR